MLAALVAAATGLWRLDRTPPNAEDEGWPPLPEARASCPDAAEHAGHAARAALAAGTARSQRYVFAPREGRLAVERFAEAAECARVAQDEPLQAAATQQLTRLRGRIERDARDHFRRYRHLARLGRAREAASDVAFLLELGWPERGPLIERLRRDSAAAADVAEAGR